MSGGDGRGINVLCLSSRRASWQLDNCFSLNSSTKLQRYRQSALIHGARLLDITELHLGAPVSQALLFFWATNAVDLTKATASTCAITKSSSLRAVTRRSGSSRIVILPVTTPITSASASRDCATVGISNFLAIGVWPNKGTNKAVATDTVCLDSQSFEAVLTVFEQSSVTGSWHLLTRLAS